MKRKRSCPFLAAASAAPRELTSVAATWSTVTSVPLRAPHAFVYSPSNQRSYAGTKWLHWRMRRVFRRGTCASFPPGAGETRKGARGEHRSGGPDEIAAGDAPRRFLFHAFRFRAIPSDGRVRGGVYNRRRARPRTRSPHPPPRLHRRARKLLPGPLRRKALRGIQDHLPDLRADVALPRAHSGRRRRRRPLGPRRLAGRSRGDARVRLAGSARASRRRSTSSHGPPRRRSASRPCRPSSGSGRTERSPKPPSASTARGWRDSPAEAAELAGRASLAAVAARTKASRPPNPADTPATPAGSRRKRPRDQETTGLSEISRRADTARAASRTSCARTCAVPSRRGEKPFVGIHGYDRTVLPSLSERDPVPPRLPAPRPARPGEDAPAPPPRQPARCRDPGDRRQRAERRPASRRSPSTADASSPTRATRRRSRGSRAPSAIARSSRRRT